MKNKKYFDPQSENFSFCRVPRSILKGESCPGLSMHTRVLYCLMLDRVGLSAKNGWRDEDGRVFIYYPLDEIMQDLACSHTKACRVLAELEERRGFGLIERRKQGQGKPARIYVKQFDDPQQEQTPTGHTEERSQDFSGSETRSAQNEKSGLPEMRNADFREKAASNNYKNKTEKSYLDPSIYPPEADGWIEDKVKEQIDYPLLAESYPNDDPDAIVGLICDTLSSRAETIKIGGEAMPAQKVKERFRKLAFDHVAYVIDMLKETTSKIRNIRAYLLTALYNAPLTVGPYYAAAVRHDFG